MCVCVCDKFQGAPMSPVTLHLHTDRGGGGCFQLKALCGSWGHRFLLIGHDTPRIRGGSWPVITEPPRHSGPPHNHPGAPEAPDDPSDIFNTPNITKSGFPL